MRLSRAPISSNVQASVADLQLVAYLIDAAALRQLPLVISMHGAAMWGPHRKKPAWRRFMIAAPEMNRNNASGRAPQRCSARLGTRSVTMGDTAGADARRLDSAGPVDQQHGFHQDGFTPRGQRWNTVIVSPGSAVPLDQSHPMPKVQP